MVPVACGLLAACHNCLLHIPDILAFAFAISDLGLLFRPCLSACERNYLVSIQDNKGSIVWPLIFSDFQKNTMLKSLSAFVTFVFLFLFVTSCSIVGDIFGAGVYTGVFIVVLVLGLIIMLIVRLTRRR